MSLKASSLICWSPAIYIHISKTKILQDLFNSGLMKRGQTSQGYQDHAQNLFHDLDHAFHKD